MKALIIRARMIANALHLGGRYEGARTLGECADALESLFAQANEAVARLSEAVAVEKAYGFTIQEFQGDIERERENTRRCQRELNKALNALEAAPMACRMVMAETAVKAGELARAKDTRGADEASFGVHVAAECERRVRAAILKAGVR